MFSFKGTKTARLKKYKNHRLLLFSKKAKYGLISILWLFFFTVNANVYVLAVETTTSSLTKSLAEEKTELVKRNTEGASLSEKRPGRIGFSDFFVTFITLILILFLIIFIAWLVKRSGFIIGGNNQLIRLLASVPVGQKERVALIQVGEEQILIGVAAGNVRKLHVLKEPIEVNEKSSEKINHNIFELALKKYQNKKIEK